jgi:hypothetical protein
MKVLMTLALTTLIVGCAAKAMSPGAQQVRFMQSEPADCKYLGEVTGNQGNFLTGGWTSNANLETGARNDMKNQAHNLGGNVIVLLTNRAGQTGSYSSGWGGGSQQTNVTMTGTVFSCPQE